MPDAALAVDAAGDDGLGSSRLQRGAEAVGVVAPVGGEALEAGRVCKQGLGRSDVGCVAGRERQRDRSAKQIADGVNFGGLTTPRVSDRLRLGPPLAPWAERCAFT